MVGISHLQIYLAIRNRGYTDKTHLRGFQTLNFFLVHVRLAFRRKGGLCLCRREFHSPGALFV
jgi:hypothetical protein